MTQYEATSLVIVSLLYVHSDTPHPVIGVGLKYD